MVHKNEYGDRFGRSAVLDRQEQQMAELSEPEPPLSESCRRLNELLELQSERGLTQQQIAAKAKIPPAYLSDIKHDRRPLTELVARRISEEFDVSHEWLLGRSERVERTGGRVGEVASLWLPILPHPIEGDPKSQPAWDGTSIELAGMVRAKVAALCMPYVLRFGRNDRKGRLQKGDLILMSQSPNNDAEIRVVKEGKDLYLARRLHKQWQRVSDDKRHPEMYPGNLSDVGHCVGILWGTLIH